MAATVLGIHVDDELLASWRTWLAPERQPFFVAGAGDVEPLPPELRDTFKAWRVRGASHVVWFDEGGFLRLPRSDRAALVRSQLRLGRGAVPSVRGWADLVDAAVVRSQADGHRFVWWPSLVSDAIVIRTVVTGERPSRHADVDRSTWRRCEAVLPGARTLAGTFARSSGPNCFGAVLGAAGVEAAADEWVLQGHFLDWLADRCPATPDDDGAPGTVLVWSGADGAPAHAAVTIGDGWALEKPSQCWWSPRVVLPVRELIRANRSPGLRLRRHRIRTHPPAR